MHALQVENIFAVAHNEEKVKTTSLCFLCSYVRKRTYLCPNTAKVIIKTFLNTSVQWHIMRKKIKTTSLCSLCPYVKLDVSMPKHDKTNDWLVHLSTCQPANHCKLFGKKFNTKSGLFIHQLPTLPQKKRFSRRFVLAQKGVSCKRKQNEYALHKTAICTTLWAICSQMRCNMPQNALRFGTKRKVKCR